jgi:hypothetical protein
MLEWFAITCSATRLGLEAQNAAAFRLLRLAGGLAKTAADEITSETVAPPANTAPASVAVAPKRRHAASKVHKKATPVKRGKRSPRP